MTYQAKSHLNAVMIGKYPDDWDEFWMGELFDCENDDEVVDCLSDFFDYESAIRGVERYL